MGLGKKVGVEPLSEQRWSRIERQLFDRVADGEAEDEATVAPSGPAPRWRMAAALVLAGGITAIGGGAAWHLLGGPGRTASLASSRVATDRAGSRINVGEATVDIAPQSAVTLTGDDAHGVTVVLERGRVECEVPPRDGRPPFSVEAGDVIVRVVGTHFVVAHDGADVSVDVQRGVVQVTQRDRRTDVHPGERWPSVAALAPPPVAGTTTVEPPATVELPAMPSPAPSSSTSAPAQPGAGAPRSPREQYESASRLEATRPDLAIATYRELAAKGGPWGMNALYAEGRLQADRGHSADARRALNEYLARYPAGPNANDARQLLDRMR